MPSAIIRRHHLRTNMSHVHAHAHAHVHVHVHVHVSGVSTPSSPGDGAATPGDTAGQGAAPPGETVRLGEPRTWPLPRPRARATVLTTERQVRISFELPLL